MSRQYRRATPTKRAASPASSGQLRIIGGEWRSRRLSFPDAEGLRPTTDRVRETLFNWLAPHVAGSRVLDPFAGSGALLLEALSRGASSALAFELNPEAVRALQHNLTLLRCERAEVRSGDALQQLGAPPAQPFDLVFLDPPFHRDLLLPAAQRLEEHGWLAADAWIYCESEQAPSSLGLPGNWQLHREKQAGQAWFSLWQRD